MDWQTLLQMFPIFSSNFDFKLFLGMVFPSYSPQTFGRLRQEDNEFQY